MKHEEMLAQLSDIRQGLEKALNQVKHLIIESCEERCAIEQVRGESACLPDSFSEDKEKFLAP